MKTKAEERKAAARKAVKLMKELKNMQEMLRALPREDRNLFREEADDITAKLSWALIECGRHEEALAFALKLPKKTHSEDRHICEGTALADLGRHDEARVVLEKGFKKHPESVPILNSLGNCYGRLGRYEDSRACYVAALRLVPRDPKILFNKAAAIANLGLYEDAMDIVSRLLRRWPEDPLCNALMGYCYKEMGCFEDASGYLKRAIKNGDDDPLTYDNLYWSYRDMGLLNDATALAQEAIRKFPDKFPDLYRDLACSYLEMDWVDEAREVLNKGLKIFPGDPNLKEVLDDLDEDPEDDGGGQDAEKVKPILVVIDAQRQEKRL